LWCYIREVSPTIANFSKGLVVVNFLHAEIQKSLFRPDVREKLVAAGAESVSMSPTEAARHIDSEVRRWGDLVQKARIKLD